METKIIEPKVELKKVKMFRGMDGIGLNADVWINGVNCLFALDDGNGGGICFSPQSYDNPTIKKNVALLEAYIKSLPPHVWDGVGLNGRETFSTPATMETYIEDLLQKKEVDDFLRKRDKRCLTALVWGDPDGGTYSYIDFKKPLAEVLPSALQNHYQKVMTLHCKGKVVILNKNLPAHIKNIK